jgi:hypothetical protein
MTDVDGSKDEVWVATGERTLEIARQYYNCSTLSGLPLMGENPLGEGSRGSHWETRLLADDIMAYGNGGAVSAFTLAILEGNYKSTFVHSFVSPCCLFSVEAFLTLPKRRAIDTGLYLADHSKGDCIAWGRAQGCEFVSSRCGIRHNDLSVLMPQELCAREHPTDTRCTAWELSSETGEQQRLCWSPDTFLASHCDDPQCSRAWDTGSPSDVQLEGVHRCNAECVSDVVTAVQWERETVGAGNVTLSNVTGTRQMQACGLDIPPAVVQALISTDDGDTSGLAASGAISATIGWAKELILVTFLILIFACITSCCNCKSLAERILHSRLTVAAIDDVVANSATSAPRCVRRLPKALQTINYSCTAHRAQRQLHTVWNCWCSHSRVHTSY